MASTALSSSFTGFSAPEHSNLVSKGPLSTVKECVTPGEDNATSTEPFSSAEEISALEILVEDLTNAASQVVSYLKSTSSARVPIGYPGSYDVPLTAPDSIKRAKQSLLNTTTAIQQLVSSPTDLLQQMTINYHHAACIRWLCKFSLPTIVPTEGSITYHDAAAAAKVPESQLRRVARMAITAGVFREPVSDAIAHTSTSLQMREGSSYLDSILFMTETNMPTAAKMVEMTEIYQGSDARNGTAFNVAMQTELPFFPYLAQNPVIAKRLASGMKQVAAGEAAHVKHLVNGFDWAGLGKAKVIDLGGSMGHVSMALAESFSELSFVVQDLPDVIKRAAAQELSPSMASRITFQPHNFLVPQPESSKNAEVFLLRQCLQNWPWKDAVQILRSLLPSLGESSRIVIMNVVLPEPGSTSIREEAIGRTRDMLMMQAMNGGERDLVQWKQLLHETDPALEIVNVRKPAGSLMSVIEVGRV